MGKQIYLVAVVLLVATIIPQSEGKYCVCICKRQDGQLTVLGHTCRYNQVKSYDTVQNKDIYRGIIACPGWTSITGQAIATDESKVKDKTVADFVQKALKAGIITEDQARLITGQ